MRMKSARLEENRCASLQPQRDFGGRAGSWKRAIANFFPTTTEHPQDRFTSLKLPHPAAPQVLCKRVKIFVSSDSGALTQVPGSSKQSKFWVTSRNRSSHDTARAFTGSGRHKAVQDISTHDIIMPRCTRRRSFIQWNLTWYETSQS